MLKRPMVFTVDEQMRLPSVSRFHFIECGANTGMKWGNVVVPTVQYTHGMLSRSEFTGVRLIDVLQMCGVDLKRSRFVLAEGGNVSAMTRTIPMALITGGQVLLAYGQNGEMLRPEHGYPPPLVVSSVQGVSWVKWLRRMEVGDRPYANKDKNIHYIDLMPDGQHREYTLIQEVKSVVTTPSGVRSCSTRFSITSATWPGRAAAGSPRSMSRSMVAATGGPRGWRPRCWTTA